MWKKHSNSCIFRSWLEYPTSSCQLSVACLYWDLTSCSEWLTSSDTMPNWIMYYYKTPWALQVRCQTLNTCQCSQRFLIESGGGGGWIICNIYQAISCFLHMPFSQFSPLMSTWDSSRSKIHQSMANCMYVGKFLIMFWYETMKYCCEAWHSHGQELC